MSDAMTDAQNLGPLAFLSGTWEGDKGDDKAPDDNRGVETNKYRERMVFEPTGLVQNHEQYLYGLRYRTTAWRIGEPDPFHEEVGYWMWDAAARQVIRCFIVPRGVTVIAGGTVAPEAKSFTLAAEVGSDTYGICSNRFLDAEFKTVKYDIKITVLNKDSFSYEGTTHLKIKGQEKIFPHIDKYTMNRV